MDKDKFLEIQNELLAIIKEKGFSASNAERYVAYLREIFQATESERMEALEICISAKEPLLLLVFAHIVPSKPIPSIEFIKAMHIAFVDLKKYITEPDPVKNDYLNGAFDRHLKAYKSDLEEN